MTETAKGYHVLTWGCQMNEEDSEQMGLYLEQLGLAPVATAAEADVILLNTCSVRRKPEEKVFSKLGELRELKEERAGIVVGVCGCMAQIEHEEILRRAPFVDFVVGTGQISALPDLVRAAWARTDGEAPAAVRRKGAGRALDLPERKGAVVSDIPHRAPGRRPSIKAHVPIMYGCDKFCTFCVVPLTRGRERSRPTADVMAEVRELAALGVREITLLGQTVNSYGKNLPEGRVPFAQLLGMIDGVEGIERIRFTSPYPRDFTDELVEAIAALPHVCEHVHLPLQVADDALLRHMHRGYTLAEFDVIVQKLRAAVPGGAITTDLMLGYPGETDEQFRNTMDYVAATRFDAAFMFAYSPRPGTKAADMPDQVPQDVKVARLNALIDLQNRISAEKCRACVGDVVEVLVERPSSRNAAMLSGYTRTLRMVHFPGATEATPPGSLVRVRVEEGGLTGFLGTPM